MNTIDFLNRNRGIGVELLEKYVSMSLWTIIVGIINKYVVSKMSQDVSRCLKIPTRKKLLPFANMLFSKYKHYG